MSIQAAIPGCIGIERAPLLQDKNGTDFFAKREHGLDHLNIDIKVRDTDPTLFSPPSDDFALETFSVLPDNGNQAVVGWTRDERKNTDYILWFWTETRRWCLVPFPLLCSAFSRRWEEWRSTYRVARQSSGGWRSECVFTPRRVVWAEMYRISSGTLTGLYGEKLP